MVSVLLSIRQATSTALVMDLKIRILSASLAIGLVFKALASPGLSRMRGTVCILSDCKAATHGAFCGRSEALPGLARSVWTDLCIAEARGFRVKSLWVPAHGRHLKWKPPEGYDADYLRELNHQADKAAKAAMERRLHPNRTL